MTSNVVTFRELMTSVYSHEANLFAKAFIKVRPKILLAMRILKRMPQITEVNKKLIVRIRDLLANLKKNPISSCKTNIANDNSEKTKKRKSA